MAGQRDKGKRRTYGLAKVLEVELIYVPDRQAMLAALRVVLGLPKRPPDSSER